MEELYYSKKLNTYFPTRLDVLLYAHDGRGLGHASRAIGIGMALRRCYPKLRILLVTGANVSQTLIGNSQLDWIKLPSYASMIVEGVSTGVDGPANFYKSVLGKHRSAMLAQIIQSFKPKCVLVDHNPMGKRKELLAALQQAKEFDTRWILGLRAVIGTQKDFWSEAYANIFQHHYSGILWYGDSAVLSRSHLDKINQHFSCQAEETGYVSRLYETKMVQDSQGKTFTGLLSIPWFSKNSSKFLSIFRDALVQRNKQEKWVLYLAPDETEKMKELFAKLPNCIINPVGEQYSRDILQADVAIVYSGYNSLMDIIAAEIPAILLQRDMKDQEQDIHIKQLTDACPDHLVGLEDDAVSSQTLNKVIDSLLSSNTFSSAINIRGSEQTAQYLAALCEASQQEDVIACGD